MKDKIEGNTEGKREERESRTDVHADDYGLSVHASEEIIHCIRQGWVDSISIMPNMSCFETAVNMLKEQVPPGQMPLYSVHLNFMEGHCLSDPSEVPELVDNVGMFKVSWGSLCVDSFRFGKRRKRMKIQLKKEIKAQIERIRNSGLSNRPFRIDSHQHSHMIPVVFDALTEVVREENYKVEYIRMPEEPQLPYLKAVSLWHTYSPINIIKNLILNLFAKRNRRMIRDMDLNSELLWGLVFSGEMDQYRIKSLWPGMTDYIRKRNSVLEILFHPGRALPEEIGKEYVKPGFVKFHLSEGRDREKRAMEWISQVRKG